MAPGPSGLLAFARMNETSRTSEDLELRRKKLGYRARHRGTREMDFVLGRFADAALSGMNETEIADLEALMEAPDPELYDWIAGRAEVPAEYDTPIYRRLAAFHRAGKGAGAR